MLHVIMSNHYFYYGIIAAGILGLVSMFLTNQFYHIILKDLRRMDKPRGKWMKSLLSELSIREAKNQEIRNTEVFVRSKMESGHILKLGIGSLEIFRTVMTAVVAVFTGLAVYDTFLVGTSLLVRMQYLTGGIAVCVGLLLLRPLFGIEAKELRILDGLTDYIENGRTVVPQKAEQAAYTEPVKDSMLDQVMKGIRQTAATGSKFSGLLTEEEETILREVIREYIA